MRYTIPFTEDSVREELCGTPMVFSQMLNDTVISVKEVTLSEDSGWHIADGILCLDDDRGSTTAKINGLKVERGETFLCGEVLGSDAKSDDKVCVVLAPKVAMGDDFEIVISSHRDYEADTVPRLIRSLKREGIARERIHVVVGGAASRESSSLEDYNRIQITENLMGLVGIEAILLGLIVPERKYTLLLHDTCEAQRGFVESVSQVDMALPFDFIGLTGLSGYLAETGFWSNAFLSELRQRKVSLRESNPTKLVESLVSSTRLKSVIGDMQPKRARDVYGTGTKRTVMESSALRLKKFKGDRYSGGRP